MPAAPAPHDDLAPLTFLLGTWQGGGKGTFPTIRPFRYGEEMLFEHVGDPFVLYSQRSWLEPGGDPLHFERGFLRPAGEGRIELVLAHPLGLTEVAEGEVDGTVIHTTSTAIGRTATGDPVTRLVRRLRVDGDRLDYELEMATETVPLGRHLTGNLRRI
jgi:THAP4-like, heme-binding beta-barrel domain